MSRAQDFLAKLIPRLYRMSPNVRFHLVAKSHFVPVIVQRNNGIAKLDQRCIPALLGRCGDLHRITKFGDQQQRVYRIQELSI